MKKYINLFVLSITDIKLRYKKIYNKIRYIALYNTELKSEK